MQVDTRTIVLIVGRLRALVANPRLFDDRMSPRRVLTRLDRVLNWLGAFGRVVASDYLRRQELPAPGRRRWSRQRDGT